MKRAFTALLSAFAGLTAALPAFAHSGEHSELHPGQAVAHIPHSSYHLTGIAAGTPSVAAVIRKAAARNRADV